MPRTGSCQEEISSVGEVVDGVWLTPCRAVLTSHLSEAYDAPMRPLAEAIGSQIRAHRKRLGWTQDDLRDRVNATRKARGERQRIGIATISSIERGGNMKTDSIEELVAALGLSTEVLLHEIRPVSDPVRQPSVIEGGSSLPVPDGGALHDSSAFGDRLAELNTQIAADALSVATDFSARIHSYLRRALGPAYPHAGLQVASPAPGPAGRDRRARATRRPRTAKKHPAVVSKRKRRA